MAAALLQNSSRNEENARADHRAYEQQHEVVFRERTREILLHVMAGVFQPAEFGWYITTGVSRDR